MKEDQVPKLYLYKRIVDAKLFIDSSLTEDIDLDLISTTACFSKFHFIRLFRMAYGKTPYQYLTYVRMEKAKQLRQTGMSVTDVCFTLRFETTTSFTGSF